jgi:uroporphyrinogen-III synthase
VHYASEGHLIHYPVIKIVPRGSDRAEIREAFERLSEYTHILFTSKNSVAVFFQQLRFYRKRLGQQKILAIGKVTEAHLLRQKVGVDQTAEVETQEGIIEALTRQDLKDSFLFLPRSSLSRPKITEYLQEHKIRFLACDLYDTEFQKLEPVPDLDGIDEIVFTSPSTVQAFLEIYLELPKNKKLTAIGPITQEFLCSKLALCR